MLSLKWTSSVSDLVVSDVYFVLGAKNVINLQPAGRKRIIIEKKDASISVPIEVAFLLS